MKKRNKKIIQDENVDRCLEARRNLERKYPTNDAFFGFLESLEKQPWPKPTKKPAVLRVRKDP